jgi:pantoate--beta-alanine ligase
VIEVVEDLTHWRKVRPRGSSIGFVPTMGALHDGHLSLVRRALIENDYAIVSIFVNPTQFDNPDDLANYPATFEADRRLLDDAGCHFLLHPQPGLIYRDGYRVRVTDTEHSRVLEGAHRSGHFDGVLTVVMKLLNMVGASRAYFGEKDFQQLLVVTDMAKALFHATRIVPCPTIREADGLAMSSRNRRLNAAQRTVAGAWAALLADRSLGCEDVIARLDELGFSVDYVVERWGRRLGAAHVPRLDGGPDVRLIDNVAIVDAEEDDGHLGHLPTYDRDEG